MFSDRWRKHWGLTQDPFSCEDADKDATLARMREEAVHSAFDRLYGDPHAPAPGIVFGEKGSGKSGLRLTMRRKLERLNEAEGRVLCTEYVDFDSYLERFRRAVGGGNKPDAVGKAIRQHWALADHLDAILSGGVTEYVDRFLDANENPGDLSPKQRADLLLLTALYYESRQRTTTEALAALRGRLPIGSPGGAFGAFGRFLLSVLAVAVALVPVLGPKLGLDEAFNVETFGPTVAWLIGGGVLLAAAWIPALMNSANLSANARSSRHIRVLARDSSLVLETLKRIKPNIRKEFALPQGADSGTRYDHLARLQSILAQSGYVSWYVLFDRIDEPSALHADPDGGRRFVETILDHKLLQIPGLALKMFLPLELDGIYRDASPEDLKRMRLDKSNLVPALDWTGQELIEIANQRIEACRSGDGIQSLQEFFAEDVDPMYLQDTLRTLGTPRYAMGFLTGVFQEYARNIPGDLGDDDARWRVPRAHFDLIRANWIDQTNLLRRKLN